MFELSEPILPGKGRQHIEADIPPEAIDINEAGVRLEGPIRVAGDVARSDDRVKVSGTLKGLVERECTRCAVPNTREMQLDFDAVFVGADAISSDEELEVEEAELNEGLLPENGILLADIVGEQILLSLSEQELCSEDCKGACPQCGANLNLIDCKCEDDAIDPRWSVLKDLH